MLIEAITLNKFSRNLSFVADVINNFHGSEYSQFFIRFFSSKGTEKKMVLKFSDFKSLFKGFVKVQSLF